jgi:hypothetical protein
MPKTWPAFEPIGSTLWYSGATRWENNADDDRDFAINTNFDEDSA